MEQHNGMMCRLEPVRPSVSGVYSLTMANSFQAYLPLCVCVCVSSARSDRVSKQV